MRSSMGEPCKERALVFAGAFNPITIAHLERARYALSYVHYDKVVFVPSKSSYIKNVQEKDFAYSDKERLRRLRLVKQNYPFRDVSDYELKQKDQPKTYLTLKEISKSYQKVSLLIGSDKLIELETGWKYVDEIGQEFGFVVRSRKGRDLSKIIEESPYLKERKSYFTLVPFKEDYQDISSSRVRKNRRQGRDVSPLVPKEIRKELLSHEEHEV